MVHFFQSGSSDKLFDFHFSDWVPHVSKETEFRQSLRKSMEDLIAKKSERLTPKVWNDRMYFGDKWKTLPNKGRHIFN